tara:strand:- start:125 stop:226 length:102 start_codon:yes stop_codon:yes gene_type:complete
MEINMTMMEILGVVAAAFIITAFQFRLLGLLRK